MTRCDLCPGLYTCLPPDGEGQILFVGEAPGKVEQEKGRVFAGPTGQEIDQHYLPLAALRRPEVVFTNAIRCLPDTGDHKLKSSQAKHLALLESCSRCHLYPLIEELQPTHIVAMGGFACRVLCPDVDLERQHGFPATSQWGIPVFPMFHPAMGMHEPKKMLYIREDWQRLKKFVRGVLRIPSDNYTEPDYAEATLGDIHDLNHFAPLGGDTESSWRVGPVYLTFSQHAGTGRLIRAGDNRLLRAFSERLQDWHAPVLFHNWAADEPILRQMGIRIQNRHLVDTMARAFHLGNLPQGLKALAWRELGMVMDDFVDVVGPHSRELVLNYYFQAAAIDWPKPDEQLIYDDEGNLKTYKPQGLNTKLKRFFTDYSKNPEGKDPIEMWGNWAECHEMVEEKLGPWPGLDITHVPFEEAMYYACRDADALIRLWPLLQRMSRRVRKVSHERWRD